MIKSQTTHKMLYGQTDSDEPLDSQIHDFMLGVKFSISYVAMRKSIKFCKKDSWDIRYIQQQQQHIV